MANPPSSEPASILPDAVHSTEPDATNASGLDAGIDAEETRFNQQVATLLLGTGKNPRRANTSPEVKQKDLPEPRKPTRGRSYEVPKELDEEQMKRELESLMREPFDLEHDSYLPNHSGPPQPPISASGR